jgi:membrane associated rhomboid family serine protease
VIAFSGGVDPKAERKALGLAPSAYYAGLRPSTWTVDLEDGQVRGPRFSSDGVLRPVLAAAASGGDLPGEGYADLLQQRHLRQLGAFQELMRGRQPVVTYALIAVNVAIFVLMYASGALNTGSGIQSYGAVSAQLVEQGQWWRLITSMFLHASFAHILFNMTSLFAVGTLAERLYGSVKFLAIYLGAGVVGGLASMGWALVAGNPAELGLGASGAIFGVAGALLTLRFQPSDVVPLALRQRVSSAMAPLVAISLPLSYALTPNVDNSAHIGGLLGGMALSFLLPVARRVPEPR